MDEIVRRAMARWPNVPACAGWLGLDLRGCWYLRDAAAQARGGFSSGLPGARGERLEHAGLIAFIGRNYAADERGRWFFQNGPQRVFVELELTPWIWRVDADGQVLSHTGRAARVDSVWVDERGRVLLQTDLGPGLVHSQDMHAVAERVEHGDWTPQAIQSAALAARFGFVASPQALG
ncbi:MAG TPA: DUF2946 family protein [Ottowia sp.]|uniref:DUF2946 family protein n=1 Tax=Ottowia sp. TaxID=1898956 RepID=UPI002C451D7A|nr:DUF2946 family protein [Ottowia sp.]HMN22649.1 DUF2946 family protein [Ottowia sp.]